MNTDVSKSSPENQKFLAKLTKNGLCRKIKCVEDMFNVLCISDTRGDIIKWIYKPTLFLYIPKFRDIADHSRLQIQEALSQLITILKCGLNDSSDNDAKNIYNINDQDLITVLNNLVEILFLRNKDDKLTYFDESIPILLTFGLSLEDYFYAEFKQ